MKKTKDWKMGWKEFEKLSRKLARKIKASPFKPDFIVCVSRGGLLLGRLLSEYLNLPLAVVTAKSYSDRKRTKLRINLAFSTLTPVKGRVLLADDIADSGKTFETLYGMLAKNRRIKKLRTAALVEKRFSKFKPDFIAAKYDGWVVFPYERK